MERLLDGSGSERNEPLAVQDPTELDCPRGTRTILLVDDEALVRNVGARILTRLGYRVLTAANADEAIAIAEANPDEIDLLFTDIVMPGMTGRDLADRIRNRLPAVRVLYTSGYTENVVLERGLIEHGVGYLSKPYGPQALEQCIREVLA